MKAKVIWIEDAFNELSSIYEYLVENAGEAIAKNLIETIYDTSQIEQFPLSGTIEDKLPNLKYEYRYLVKGNYKLVYRVEFETIIIVDVFDCRKDPKQMKKQLK